MPTKNVLIVEDDSQISKSLSMGLEYAGYKVFAAENLQQARGELTAQKIHVLLLDVNLPDGSGLSLLKEVREQNPDLPVLILSARTDESTVVQGMNLGADDYLRKPFGLEELKARLNRALQRVPEPEDLLEAGPLKIHHDKRSVFYGEAPLNVSRREFDILTILCKKKGDVVTRENIMQSLGEDGSLYDRTIDSHISHLRRKLRAISQDELQIVPVYGVGYRLHWTRT